MHIQLINAQLRAHGVALALLKQDMSPKDKAAAVATFQVTQHPLNPGCRGCVVFDSVSQSGPAYDGKLAIGR